MNVVEAVSPRSCSEPASNMRNIDQGPLRSSTDGGVLVSSWTVIAVRGEGPGHCTVTGAAAGGGGGGGAPGSVGPAGPAVTGLVTAVPPISIFAVALGPAMALGFTANDTIGRLPPLWKKASRISAARWKSRIAPGVNERATALSCRHVHCGLDMSAYGARYCLKNPSMMPFGLNTRAKSASGTSRSLPRVKGYRLVVVCWQKGMT